MRSSQLARTGMLGKHPVVPVANYVMFLSLSLCNSDVARLSSIRGTRPMYRRR